jgi:hypothetical protein
MNIRKVGIAVTLGELGQDIFSTKLADKILPNSSKAAAIHTYVYSIFPTCEILSLAFP